MSADDSLLQLQHSNLSKEEIAEYREIFTLVDKDGGGSIDKDELKQLMETLRLKPTEEELDAMMEEVDTNGSEDIDFNEFLTVMTRPVKADYTPEQLRSAWKVFETDNVPHGYVATKVLESALISYGGEKLRPGEAPELVATVDPEGTGKIHYMEFINMMSTSSTSKVEDEAKEAE